MNWIKAFKTMDRRQKMRLKRNLRMIYGNILFQVAVAFLLMYGVMALYEVL